MRTIARVGMLVGGLGALTLFALAPAVGLIVVFGVLLTGIIAGLCTAKWLRWEWYGRQFPAGLRSGALACGLAGCGALAGLLMRAPLALPMLAAASHLGQIDLSREVMAVGPLGAISADILGILLMANAALLLAGLTCQLFAWSKSSRTVHVIAQAQRTALALRQSESAPPTPSSFPTGTPVPSSNPWWLGAASATGQLAPGFASAAPWTGTFGTGTFGTGTFETGTLGMPQLAPAAPDEQAGEDAPTSPALPAVPLATDEEAITPLRRHTSDARPLHEHMTSEMADAFAAWAEEEQRAAAKKRKAKARTPQPSAFLTDVKTPARRNRKKQETRDWLC